MATEWIPREVICRKYNIDRHSLNKLIELDDWNFPKGKHLPYGDSNVLMFRADEIAEYWRRYEERKQEHIVMLRGFIKPKLKRKFCAQIGKWVFTL